jgi:hypothetical protein
MLLASTFAMAASMGESAQPEVSQSYGSVAVSFVGWPNITGLTVMSGGSLVTPRNGVYTVRNHATITVLAAGVELATLAAKPNITLFDLISTHECGSSTELGKLASLLLALDSDSDPTNGISIAASTQPTRHIQLAELSAADRSQCRAQQRIACDERGARPGVVDRVRRNPYLVRQ